MLFNIWKYGVLWIGFALIFIVPPFHTPDEYNHFYKAYAIADGQMTPVVDYQNWDLGGYIPRSLVTVVEPFKRGIFDINYKFSYDTIWHYCQVPLNQDDVVLYPFSNTARYAPTAYLPQVFAIFIARVFDCPPLVMTYLGRIFTFLFWYVILLYAIRRAPVFKEGMMILSALPASVSINSSLNADIVSNAFFFLGLSAFLKMRLSNEIEKKDLGLFSGTILLITLNKIAYFPLVLLLLFVPKEKFGLRFSKIKVFTVNLVLNLLIVFSWTKLVHRWIYPTDDINVTTYTTLRPGFNVNPDLQMRHVLDNFFPVAYTLVDKSIATYDFVWRLYLTSFGWEYAMIPKFLQGLLLVSILAYFFFHRPIFSKKERFLLFLLAHSLTTLFLFSMYLHWDPVGGEMTFIYGGKYYIPIYPLVFLALSAWLYSYRPAFYAKSGTKWAFLSLYALVYLAFFQVVITRYYF
jgi:uncharacterized membrane protein